MRVLFVGVIGVLATGVVVTASATTYGQEWSAAKTTATVAAVEEQTVTGKVRTTASEWHGQRILTRVTIDIADSPSVEFLVAGGSVDGITMRVTGAPKFELGQRVRVTVRATETGLRLVGLGTRSEVLP